MAKEAIPNEHPLLTLRGRRVADYTLDVEAWTGRFVGQAEFVVYLTGPAGERSLDPVVEGLYGRARIPGGRAGLERGILDVILAAQVELGVRRVELKGSDLEQAIVAALCGTIKDTWSAMMYLAYGWKTLKQIQELHHPVQVTDEGHLLFMHGFRGGWKDYYYSEGWWEGPIKLKAERPPNAEYRMRWDEENAGALLAFLTRPPGEGRLYFQEEGSDEMTTLSILALERAARARALRILPGLDLADPALVHERDRLLAIYPPAEFVGNVSADELQRAVVKAAEAR